MRAVVVEDHPKCLFPGFRCDLRASYDFIYSRSEASEQTGWIQPRPLDGSRSREISSPFAPWELPTYRYAVSADAASSEQGHQSRWVAGVPRVIALGRSRAM